MTEKSNQGPLVDDNWKEQVAREKAAARRAERAAARSGEREIPPASFALLVTTYSTQALIALGLYPDPVSGQPKPDREMARHLIDMLGVIEQVSKGNIGEQDRQMLDSVLHQLRMAFLSGAGQNSGGADSSDPPSTGPELVLPS